MTDEKDPRLPPKRSDKYERAWELIDTKGIDVVTPVDCILYHMEVTYHVNKKETSNKYLGQLFKNDRVLKENNLHRFPWTIDEEDVRTLLTIIWKDRAVSTKKWYTHILDRYLQFYGNDTVKDMKIEWAQDMRPNVDWLTDEEYATLMNVKKTPLEEIVIALELSEGLRSVEVVRLRKQDIHLDCKRPYIDVRGKGRGEGKWRRVPLRPNAIEAIKRWEIKRQKYVTMVKSYNLDWEEPDELLIWCRYKRCPTAGPYSEIGNSIGRSVVENLRKKTGSEFSQHTLRRTFGRNLFHAGTPLVTISAILGHDDVKTTIGYLGLNMDDMEAGLGLLDEFDNRTLAKQDASNDGSD